MTSTFADAYIAALSAMVAVGRPLDLNGLAADQAKYLDLEGQVADDFLVTHLANAGVNDALRAALRKCTAKWDAAVGPAWADGTSANTLDRRDVITRHLKLDEQTAKVLNERCRVAGVMPPTIIASEWTPWYSDAIRTRRYYWNDYEGYLLGKGWKPDEVAELDLATDSVVERIADPTQVEAYKTKGLVVGYVQSGKTSNFTGVLAKAIDAGYRLIIVLTGTTDLLRAQTQRRLDKELVGRENILAGIDENDDAATEGLDYKLDKAWIARNFVEHGSLPQQAGQPNIHRLTTYGDDYKSLTTGILALDFPRRDPDKPIYDPVNLFTTDARLAVVKKNGKVLKKLVADLKKTAACIEDLPVLIIDDESDQASVNTSNPKRWQNDQKERTAINRVISELLGMLPRAQYVGYTATPFANVFIDPSDAEDVFPSDFLIALNSTPGYMGASDFHDLDSLIPIAERDYANSNEKAYVRLLNPDGDDDARQLREAMDAFVLTGAIKLYRETYGDDKHEHHTMLVHENMRTSVHREQADRIRALWDAGGYYSSAAHERLRLHFEKDLAPVMRARADGSAVPDDYATLVPFVAKAVARIGETNNPVVVVNSDKIEGEKLDFDQDKVWRIVVGGNKLARGFTVEGLTISYYRRLTKQGDTLMQMGRWFGYRKGYRDLVRLYITPELYEAFEAVCRDEEYFRRELKRYAESTADGRPQITPAQVPPLVAQHLPWLKPAATNKMYNAKLTERRSPGVAVEPIGYPKAPDDLMHNAKVFVSLLELASATETFKSSQTTTFESRVGIASHQLMCEVLKSLRWLDDQSFKPDLKWLEELDGDCIRDWAILIPQHGDDKASRRILDTGPFSIYLRQRRRDPFFGAISDPKHRNAANTIARAYVDSLLPDDNAQALQNDRRGAITLYPLVTSKVVPGGTGDDIDPSALVIAFRLIAPPSAQPKDGRLVKFVTRNRKHEQAAIVDK